MYPEQQAAQSIGALEKYYVWLSNRKNEGRLTQNCTLASGNEDGAISPDTGVRLHASLTDIDCRS